MTPKVTDPYKPLFALARSSNVEIVVHGADAFKQEGKDPEGDGATISLPARSTLKPWQFLASDAFGEEDFWAIGFSSHSGQKEHLEALSKLQMKGGVGAEHLRCPSALPVDQEEAMRRKFAGESTSRIYHPCAGKHLSMLAGCRKSGFPLEGYFEKDHPLQQKLKQQIADQMKDIAHDWLVDSCGVPTLVAPLGSFLLLYENLAVSPDKRRRIVRTLWQKNPILVGGHGRPDTWITQATKGKVLSKDGADGLIVAQSVREGSEPVRGVYVKLASGYQPKYLQIGLYAALKRREPKLNGALKVLLQALETKLTDLVPRDQTLILA